MGQRVARIAYLLAIPFGLSCGESDDGAITLRYMAWGNPQQFALEKKICAEFEKYNPGIKVKLVQVPGTAYSNKMTVMLASRTAPDVMRVDHYFFPALVKKDYFLPLDDLIAADRDFSLDDFFPEAIEEGRYKDKLYGLNALFGGVIMYYNKSLVQKAGLRDPFELWKEGKWTWDRFLEHAKKMTVRRADGRYASFGAAMPDFPQNLATLYSWGATIMDPTWTRCTAGSGPAKNAWQFFHDLRYKHKVSPSPAQGANSAFNFESGKLGMLFDWMGMTPRYRELAKGFEWDCCPIPSGDGGGAVVVKGNQLVINALTRHKDASWKLAKFITGEKAERMIARIRRAFPTRKSVAYSDDYLKADLPPFNMRAFTYAVETGKPFPITSRWAEWTREFRSGMENLLGGLEEDAAVSAKAAEERANKTLSVKEGL
jgi:multiple sugar transport system substrate-binding protein